MLLDEFDEMGRNRTGDENLLSRFISTAMLPKLIAINEAKKIVFLLATNYVAGFDAAFSREGRFEMRLQVMQPNSASERAFGAWKPTFDRVFAMLGRKDAAKADDLLADLTFLETKTLVGVLEGIDETGQIMAAFENAQERGTLRKANDDGTVTMAAAEEKAGRRDKDDGPPDGAQTPRQDWKTTSIQDRTLIRLPPLRKPRRASATPMDSRPS